MTPLPRRSWTTPSKHNILNTQKLNNPSTLLYLPNLSPLP